MKKFKFSLAAVFKVTKIRKEQAEAKFGEAVQYLAEQRRIMDELINNYEKSLDDYRERQSRKLTVYILIEYSNYLEQLKQRMQQQQQVIAEAEQVKDERLAVLRAAMNKLKAIQKLYDKRWADFMAAELTEEQKQIDEIGLQLYGRNKEVQ